MFLFRQNPVKKLEKEYQDKLTVARDAQRNGRIEEFAVLMSQANEILQELERQESFQS
jgi:hypothetical protein